MNGEHPDSLAGSHVLGVCLLKSSSSDYWNAEEGACFSQSADLLQKKERNELLGKGNAGHVSLAELSFCRNDAMCVSWVNNLFPELELIPVT